MILLTSRERACLTLKIKHERRCPKRHPQTDEFACTCAVRTLATKLREAGLL